MLGGRASSPKPRDSGAQGRAGVCFDVDNNHHPELRGAMFRRSANAGDSQANDRSLPGFVFLISAAMLLLVGAYRAQGNLVSAGLMFLAFGVVFAPGAFRKSWMLKVAFFALAIIGVFYALTT